MNRIHDQAVHYLEKSIQLRKQMPGFRKDWLYSPYYHLGITYYTAGRCEDAARYLREAIADREDRLGPNDRESHRTGALYYALGNVCGAQGLADLAYSLHHRAFMQCRQTAGEAALATLRCSQKLAEHYVRYECDSRAG
jgi:tetratricopeptide (TPR) repeat protein